MLLISVILMFIDLDMDFYFWWWSYIQLFFLLSVTWVHSDIQVNVTVWSLVVYLLGSKVGNWCWNICWIRTAKKRLNLWSNSVGNFFFVCFKSRCNYQYTEYMKHTVMFCRWGLVSILIFWVLLIVLLIYFLLLLLCGIWCFIIEVLFSGSGWRRPLTERVNAVCSAAGASAVCWASHIACGTDLLFVFFF